MAVSIFNTDPGIPLSTVKIYEQDSCSVIANKVIQKTYRFNGCSHKYRVEQRQSCLATAIIRIGWLISGQFDWAD